MVEATLALVLLVQLLVDADAVLLHLHLGGCGLGRRAGGCRLFKGCNLGSRRTRCGCN